MNVVLFRCQKLAGRDIPYTDDDMQRMDESADMLFYTAPRFVTHIDNGAIDSITNYYRDVLVPESDVL